MESAEPLHPVFRDVPPPGAKLWRYLTFAKFASLLESKHMHFTRVDRFDDHFEGAWPRQDLAVWEGMKGFNVPNLTERMRRSKVAASCWVESDHESAAMWRLYAPGDESVAIATTFGQLQTVVISADPDCLRGELPHQRGLAGVGRVRYLDHSNTGLIGAAETTLPNTLWPFMLKNVSYQHEREVRALLVAAFARDIEAEGVDILFDLEGFLTEIIVSPFSQPWFFKTVAGIAQRYGLGDRLKKSALSLDGFYIKRV